MKKILFLLLVSIFLFTGCQNTNKDDDTIKIVLDWTPNTNHTGLYVAKANGYFEEENLNVEIIQPPEGGATELIGSGKAEFGISFQESMALALSSNNPIPVTAIAAIIQHNTSGVVSLQEKNITSPKNLDNKNYATWESPIELEIIKKIVGDDGGNFENINLIPSSTMDVISALNANIDALWIFYAWDGIKLEIENISVNYLNIADYGDELDYYSPVLIANNSYLEQNPEKTKKLVSAIKKGYEFCIENPKEAANILLSEVPELDETLVTKSQIWLADKYKAESTTWGYIDPTRWNNFYKWLYKNNLIENDISNSIGFSNDYLN